MPRVLDELLEQGQTLLVAVALFDRLDRAELEDGLAARLIRRQARPDVVGGLHCEVRLELLLQPPIVPASTPGCGARQPAQESAHGLHRRSSAFTSKNRPITAMVCSQFLVSACSCLRPAAVSR